MESITVCELARPLQVKEYNGQRVVTFKDIDEQHQRPDGTARRNFNENRERFIENEDFFTTTLEEFRTKFVCNSRGRGNPTGAVLLITVTGYLMLVKSFNDDLAWTIQRALVMNYFRAASPYPEEIRKDDIVKRLEKEVKLQSQESYRKRKLDEAYKQLDKIVNQDAIDLYMSIGSVLLANWNAEQLKKELDKTNENEPA